MPWDPPEIVLPASNLTTRELDSIVIAATDETTKIPLVQLAREHTTDALRVAAPSLSGDVLTWHLTPPLPCPRCNAFIETALWGGAPPRVGERASLDEIIARTRSAREELHFTGLDERYDVTCAPEIDGELHVIAWCVRLRDEDMDLRGTLLEVLRRLKAEGSVVSEPDMRRLTARFTERFTSR